MTKIDWDKESFHGHLPACRLLEAASIGAAALEDELALIPCRKHFRRQHSHSHGGGHRRALTKEKLKGKPFQLCAKAM